MPGRGPLVFHHVFAFVAPADPRVQLGARYRKVEHVVKLQGKVEIPLGSVVIMVAQRGHCSHIGEGGVLEELCIIASDREVILVFLQNIL